MLEKHYLKREREEQYPLLSFSFETRLRGPCKEQEHSTPPPNVPQSQERERKSGVRLIFVITACRRLRREDCNEFEINLGDLERESGQGRGREVDRQRHTERESSISLFLFLSWVSPETRGTYQSH